MGYSDYPGDHLTDVQAQLAATLADRYTIDRELGRGGMATVYLAHDVRHDRPVALKVLHPDLAASLGPERFQREIKLAARLQHPHILTVHDSGEAAGLLWFTMPFIEGESLRDRLRRDRQLSVEDAVRIAREAADGLEYAHQHGVVHRDIKPENILLTSGHALVADFGIALAIRSGDQQLTGTGMSIGTPAYMSPEQASGERELDARTDVYALGCVLYEMLAGEPPFSGPNAQAILIRTLTETPRPINSVRSTVPVSLDAVITKAMAKAPADRFATCAQFGQALALAAPEGRTSGETVSTGTATLGKKPRRVPLAAVLVVGLLIAAGAFFAWRRAAGGGKAGEGGPKLLAVLPFENLGAADDAYFADGITDAVRGKLANVPGVEVIARSSSTPYKGTTKSPIDIAKELGVRYLLTGTVRWDKGSDQNRVQVSPELIEVGSGQKPTTRWQQPFDATITDVFKVQADIASLVAQALDVALGATTQQQLAAKPTQNLPAYDAFLRGEAVSQGMNVNDPPSLRQAAAAYEQAVALDSTFALAWAQLARTRASLYFMSTPTPAGAEAARQASLRVSAIAPNSPEAHLALSMYYSQVLSDIPRAFAEDSTALTLAPRNPEMLAQVAVGEYRQGRWDAARAHLEQASQLDPRSVATARRLGVVYFYTRQYPKAREAFDRALALAPTNLDAIEWRAQLPLAEGDLAGARATLKTVPKDVDATALIVYFANYQDLMWVLDDAQQVRLLGLTPSAFDGDRFAWGHILAQTYMLRGDLAKARVYADSARITVEEQLRATPNDAQRHVLYGLTLAYLGRKADAIREGELGVSLQPLSKDAYNGAYFQHQLARIYIVVGEYDKALDQLEPLLKIPYYLSPGWLKIDPNFDPIRNHPRFKRLVAGA